MNLGDFWVNLQPIPVPTPEELIDYSRENNDESINEIKKLEIVDAGEFQDENDKNRPKKHVYYVGKIYQDSQENSTFVNLFTIIWD